MPISHELSTIFYAGYCALSLGILAVLFILSRAKEKKKIKIITTVIVTVIFFFICAICSSSPYFSNRPPSPIFKPTTSDIIGIYYLSNSANLLQEKGYPSLEASSFIEFNNDQTFKTENMPDLITSNRIHDENNDISTFVSGTGSWEIEFNGLNSAWRLILKFEKINDKPSSQSIHIWLYERKPPFVLYSIVGDPDSYEWIMYKKK